MDAKKFIKEYKVPLIIGGILLFVTIFYFRGKKITLGSNKGSGDLSGEDKKGGLIFDKGKDYKDFKIETGDMFGTKTTYWLRMYKDKRFKVIEVYEGKSIQPGSAGRGKYDKDGKRLLFEDGKVVEGTSMINLLSKIAEMTITFKV